MTVSNKVVQHCQTALFDTSVKYDTMSNIPLLPLRSTETGILDIEHGAKKKQILMKHRIQDNASELMQTAIDAGIKSGWKERTDKLDEELNIQPQDYTKSKETFKTHATKRINNLFRKNIEHKGQGKSKVQHLKCGQPNWNPGTMKEYLIKMTRNEASTIFKSRSRMLKVKCNYKNMYKNNLSCRACGQTDETQDHVLNQCNQIHTNNSNKVRPELYFNEDVTELRKVAFNINTQ